MQNLLRRPQSRVCLLTAAIVVPLGLLGYAHAQAVPQFYGYSTAAVQAPVAAAFGSVDTQGNPVPTYKAHSFVYDGSGNLITDTVTDGVHTWVRSYRYSATGPSFDSGWVQQ